MIVAVDLPSRLCCGSLDPAQDDRRPARFPPPIARPADPRIARRSWCPSFKERFEMFPRRDSQAKSGKFQILDFRSQISDLRLPALCFSTFPFACGSDEL